MKTSIVYAVREAAARPVRVAELDSLEESHQAGGFHLEEEDIFDFAGAHGFVYPDAQSTARTKVDVASLELWTLIPTSALAVVTATSTTNASTSSNSIAASQRRTRTWR